MRNLVPILILTLVVHNGSAPQFERALKGDAASCVFDRLGTKNWLFKDAVVFRIQGKLGSEVVTASPERKYDWEKKTAASGISAKVAAGKLSIIEECDVSEQASRPGEKEKAERLALACRAALIEAMAYRTTNFDTYVLFASEGTNPGSADPQQGYSVMLLPGDASAGLTIKLSRTFGVLDVRVHH